jgi:hypothetical protein
LPDVSKEVPLVFPDEFIYEKVSSAWNCHLIKKGFSWELVTHHGGSFLIAGATFVFAGCGAGVGV